MPKASSRSHESTGGLRSRETPRNQHGYRMFVSRSVSCFSFASSLSSLSLILSSVGRQRSLPALILSLPQLAPTFSSLGAALFRVHGVTRFRFLRLGNWALLDDEKINLTVEFLLLMDELLSMRQRVVLIGTCFHPVSTPASELGM
jgi:hypothetical protein